MGAAHLRKDRAYRFPWVKQQRPTKTERGPVVGIGNQPGFKQVASADAGEPSPFLDGKATATDQIVEQLVASA